MAGLLFMWASIPYRREISSRAIFLALAITNTLYITLNTISPVASGPWLRPPLCSGCAAGDCAVGNKEIQPPIALDTGFFVHSTIDFHSACTAPGSEWNQPGRGRGSLHGLLRLLPSFLYNYRRATAGAFITIAGFAPGPRFLWSRP